SILQENMSFLRQKICLMSLIEAVFKRSSDNRTIPFANISEETQLPIDEVEYLVMKALSLKLIRGSIDQVGEVVVVTWVQPRVLDKDQIDNMRQRLQEWDENVKKTAIFVENETPELFVHLHPEVLWAQRQNEIYVTINLVDIKDPKIDVTKDKISFEGTGGTEQKLYQFELNLYKEINPEASKRSQTARSIIIVLDKAEHGQKYWPRLQKEQDYPELENANDTAKTDEPNEESNKGAAQEEEPSKEAAKD
ncbi:26598_t:CDS:2, partial [Racocetra persica]